VERERDPEITHEDKCTTLWENLFPPPPHLTNQPPISLDPRNNDIEYVSVTRREIRDAIFTAAQLNAPGISGLAGRAWRWALKTLGDEIFHLLQTQDTT
jgi:hypothetical protein